MPAKSPYTRKPVKPLRTTSYVNKKGEDRFTILMPRWFALKIAVGDEEAMAEVQRAVAVRIGNEEKKGRDHPDHELEA